MKPPGLSTPASLRRIAAKLPHMGYDGVELAIGSPDDVDRRRLEKILSANSLELAAVSSGGGAISRGLSLCSPVPSVREEAQRFALKVVDFAGSFGAPVIFGRLMGQAETGVDRRTALSWVREAMDCAGRRARKYGTDVLIEPQNRYEANLMNRLDEGVEFIRSLEVENAKILADLFHMNVEEHSVCGALREARDFLGHIHIADSNRRPPGYRHIDFSAVGETLRGIGYDRYVVAESMAYPTPDDAARCAVECFRNRIARDNSAGQVPTCPPKGR